MSELTKKRVHWKEYNGEELVHDEDVDVLTSASAVTFSDEETLQYKYTQGQFVHPSTTGMLSNLSTTNKSSLVDAVNEVKTSATSNQSSITSLTNRMKTAEGDIDSLEKRVTPISLGGTGATTASGALSNLGLTATASELNVLDGMTATTTELNYVDGVTSAIQTQLDGKANSSHNHSADNITSGTLPIARGGTGATTASGILTNLGITSTASELNVLDGITATTAELNYTDGVTSNIQTQLNGKANSSHNHSADNITSGTLPIARGGTGATTASGILTNLGLVKESGTWTPVLKCYTGDTNPTYTTVYSYGKYYTIGNLVYVTCHCKFHITNGGSGYAHVSGFPYVAGRDMDGQGFSMRECYGAITPNAGTSDSTSAGMGGTLSINDSSSLVIIRDASGSSARKYKTGDFWLGFSGMYLKA